MAFVNHQIPANSGNYYLYEHKREGKTVRTTYLGRIDVQVVPHIPKKGYPVEGECYKEGHEAGIQAEKEQFGDKKYKEFEEHINEVIPSNELAGSHTEDGKILLHKNINPKYHDQLITHEVTEHEFMERKKCKAKGAKPLTRKISDRKVEMALQHRDVLGAGAKRRKELHLTSDEYIKAIMKEYDRGTLHSSSGKKVTTREQALAIGYSEIKANKK